MHRIVGSVRDAAGGHRRRPRRSVPLPVVKLAVGLRANLDVYVSVDPSRQPLWLAQLWCKTLQWFIWKIEQLARFKIKLVKSITFQILVQKFQTRC